MPTEPPRRPTEPAPAPEQLQAVVERLASNITRAVHEANAASEQNFRSVRVHIDGVAASLRAEINPIRDRVDKIEGRLDRSSLGTKELRKATSDADLSHDAKLSGEIVARETLAAKVDDLTASNVVQLAILSRLDKVFSNTTVKVILLVIGTAASTWLASHVK